MAFYQSFTEEDVHFKCFLTDLCWYTTDHCQPCAALPALPTSNTLTTQQGSLPSDKLPRMSSIYVNTDKPLDIPAQIPGKSTVYIFLVVVVVCTHKSSTVYCQAAQLIGGVTLIIRYQPRSVELLLRFSLMPHLMS